MMTVDQDTIYQYQDGWDLLDAALRQQGQKLLELEHLVKTPPRTSNLQSVVEFPLLSAQALLFELSIVSEHIDTLIREINWYADRCGRPRVQVISRKPQ